MHLNQPWPSLQEVWLVGGVGSLLLACSPAWEGWKPKFSLWKTCWKHGTNQTPIDHHLTPLQDSHCIWISPGHSYYRFHYKIWYCLLSHSHKGDFKTLYLCERLVGSMAQIRNLFSIHCYHDKSHTSPELVFIIHVDSVGASSDSVCHLLLFSFLN